MVKVNAPAMSLDASGALAGSLVFSKWKGRNYVRELVIPVNPKSGGQVGVRAMFKFLAQQWDGLSSGAKNSWEDRADDMIVSEFNAYMSYNQRRWRNFQMPSTQDPAQEESTAPSDPSGAATPGVRSMLIELWHGVQAPNWGYAIFRSLTSSFTLTWDKCIAVVQVDAGGDAEYIDTPLDPGTYYYNAIGFMVDGKKGADGLEFSGTIP